MTRPRAGVTIFRDGVPTPSAGTSAFTGVIHRCNRISRQLFVELGAFMNPKQAVDSARTALAAAARELSKRELVRYVLRTSASERAMARAERVLPLGVASMIAFSYRRSPHWTTPETPVAVGGPELPGVSRDGFRSGLCAADLGCEPRRAAAARTGRTVAALSCAHGRRHPACA